MRLHTVLILLAFLSLSGCFSSDEGAESVNSVSVRLAQNPETLNPVSYVDQYTFRVSNYIYQSLLTIDHRNNGIRPQLAVDLPTVEAVDSGFLYHYEIRPEANWSPGHPVTSEDVAFTIKLFFLPRLNNDKASVDYQFIRGLVPHPTNPKKFAIYCESGADDLKLLTGDFLILPRHLFDNENVTGQWPLHDLVAGKIDTQGNAPYDRFVRKFNDPATSRDSTMITGSHAYHLVAWETDKYITLKRKKEWWGDKLPASSGISAKPDEIIFRIIPDYNTSLLMLKAGRIDLMDNITSSDFRQLKKDKAFLQNYSLYSPSTYKFIYLGLNDRLPKLADSDTRRALAHLLDVSQIIELNEYGIAQPATGMISPADSAHFNDNIVPYPYNPERARAILEDAGWQQKDGTWTREKRGTKQELGFVITYKSGTPAYETIALILQEAAASIGIKTELKPVEGAVLSESLRNHEFEIFIGALRGNPFAYDFRPILHTDASGKGGYNYTGFGTTESDSLVDTIVKDTSATNRVNYLYRLQEILHEEANIIYLYFIQDKIAIHSRFTNVTISSLQPGYELTNFTLKEED
ncbi:ABC transporter substrate-binding protein [Roseivirga sp. BDSF3-8]|uniref:ABC transporter substrate-binding protein n=1 Tax=Roseivirga sp. BDSF3-8 TaxID=3241598 RepID=UPI003532502B